MDLLENTHFQEWVTMTVYRVLSESACGIERKWLLTYLESRAAACQVPRQESFDGNSSESMRVAMEAFTNLAPRAGKQHLH